MEISEESLKGSELQRVKTLDLSSLFIFSNKDINALDNESKKISLGTLISTLQEDIKKDSYFGTMIHENAQSYSKTNHYHDYTKVKISSVYCLSDSNELTSYIGTFTISDDVLCSSVDVWFPNTKFDTGDRYKIGELRFLNSNSITSKEQIQKNITNGFFDGWVYADGQQYSIRQGRYDFSSAFKKMKNDGKSTFFVPDLRYFFRGNTEDLTDSTRLIQANNLIPKHSHIISSTEYPVDVTLKTKEQNSTLYVVGNIRQTSKQPSTGIVYALQSQTKENDIQGSKIEATVNGSCVLRQSQSVRTQYSESYEREQYPTHIILIPMVWIGKDKVN